MKNQFDDDFILLDDFLKQNLEVNREHLMNLFDAGEISLFTFIYFKNKQLFFTKKFSFPIPRKSASFYISIMDISGSFGYHLDDEDKYYSVGRVILNKRGKSFYAPLFDLKGKISFSFKSNFFMNDSDLGRQEVIVVDEIEQFSGYFSLVGYKDKKFYMNGNLLENKLVDYESDEWFCPTFNITLSDIVNHEFDFISEVYVSKFQIEDILYKIEHYEDFIKHKEDKIKEEINKIESPSNNNEKMLSSHRAIIKGLLLVIDKIHNKKRIFSSPRGKITTNEISKEILTIIEENPNDFLDDKIKDRTIRKYLGDVLKEIKDD